jgi:hypothetical protein
MLWPILLKTYAAAAALYLAVTVAYIGWRFWLHKKAPPSSAEERELSPHS